MKKPLLLLMFLIVNYASFAQTIPAYVSTDSLLAWYPFNGNANNANGPWANGMVVGATLTTDRFGNANSAYYFDGITNYIFIDTAIFNVGWNNYTVSAWVNADSLTNPNSIYNQPIINTGPHNGFELAYNWENSDKYSFWANETPGVRTWNILMNGVTNDSATAHVWNHLVVVKDSGLVYRVYVNGVLDTVYRATINASSYFCFLYMGRIDTTIGPELFKGKLDDYGIWKRSLASCEVKRLFDTSAYTYLTGQPGNTTVVVAATAHFSVSDTGIGNTYQWQVDTGGSSFVNLSNIMPYSGVTTDTLTITGVTMSMNNYKYRCVVSGAYPCVDTSMSGKLLLSTLEVSNVNNNDKISIAPNPTTGDITIMGAGKVNIKVYNSIGQLVKEAGNTDKISIAEMPAGVYAIKLYDQKGLMVDTDKVIKN